MGQGNTKPPFAKGPIDCERAGELIDAICYAAQIRTLTPGAKFNAIVALIASGHVRLPKGPAPPRASGPRRRKIVATPLR